MSEERAKYHIQPAEDGQLQAQSKIILTAHEATTLTRTIAEQYPHMVIEIALQLLESTKIDEVRAATIIMAIFKQYPAMAQKVIADIEESANG